MRAKLQKRLNVIWQNNGDGGARYIPRAMPGRAEASGAWLVFDRRLQRFLEEREVIALTRDECSERLVN